MNRKKRMLSCAMGAVVAAAMAASSLAYEVNVVPFTLSQSGLLQGFVTDATQMATRLEQIPVADYMKTTGSNGLVWAKRHDSQLEVTYYLPEGFTLSSSSRRDVIRTPDRKSTLYVLRQRRDGATDTSEKHQLLLTSMRSVGIDTSKGSTGTYLPQYDYYKNYGVKLPDQDGYRYTAYIAAQLFGTGDHSGQYDVIFIEKTTTDAAGSRARNAFAEIARSATCSSMAANTLQHYYSAYTTGYPYNMYVFDMDGVAVSLPVSDRHAASSGVTVGYIGYAADDAQKINYAAYQIPHVRVEKIGRQDTADTKAEYAKKRAEAYNKALGYGKLTWRELTQYDHLGGAANAWTATATHAKTGANVYYRIMRSPTEYRIAMLYLPPATEYNYANNEFQAMFSNLVYADLA